MIHLENNKWDQKPFVLWGWMQRNGFRSINEHDSLGWRPLHYAAMNGEPSLLQALLEQRAALDSKTKKQNPYTGIPQFMTALSISLSFKNHLATQFLLEKGANRTSGLIPPMDFASMANNAEGLRMLRSTFNSGGIPDRYLDGISFFYQFLDRRFGSDQSSKNRTKNLCPVVVDEWSFTYLFNSP